MENEMMVVIDVLMVFCVVDGWTYGFSELALGYRELVKASKRILNLGCYFIGFIVFIRLLVDVGILFLGVVLMVNVVSGYMGGGKAFIKVYEEEEYESWGVYGFNFEYKYLLEMVKWSMIGCELIFMLFVGFFV